MSTVNGAHASSNTDPHTIQTKSNGSMQLLDYQPIDFSLTAGTDIPAPPPSPPPKEPAQLAVESKPVAADLPLPMSPSTLSSSRPQADSEMASPPQPNSPTTSPHAHTQNSSRRLSKFLSLKSLNSAYDPAASSIPNSSTPNLHSTSAVASPTSNENSYLNPGGPSAYGHKRPSTPSVASSTMSTTKRVRSWFRRKRKISDITPGPDLPSESGTESSAPADVERRRGPPTPTLPDLNSLGGRDDSNSLGELGGGDMFRDIK